MLKENITIDLSKVLIATTLSYMCYFTLSKTRSYDSTKGCTCIYRITGFTADCI